MEVAAANASWFDKFSSLNGDLQINMQKVLHINVIIVKKNLTV